MNLTKFFIASLCLTAMTASAIVLQSDSFESGSFSNGLLWAGPGLTTGAITDGITGLTDANTPMEIASDTKVLQLNTEGAVWTNMVTEGVFASAPIYTDMLVKFVPSEALPSIDGTVKLAIATTNGLLVVTKDDGAGNNVWVSTSTTIDTSLWYRVTVKLSFVTPLVKANVKVDGTDVTVDGNTTFDITDNDGFQTLYAIGFQGTGFIDEVVVRDDNPFGDTPVVLLTLSFATGIQSVVVDGNSKTNGASVATPSTLEITTATFYEIADVTGASTNWTVAGIGETSGSVAVSSTSNVTVTITARAETSTNAWGGATAFTNQPANKVADWAIANLLTSLDDTYYNNYLLNVSTNSLPTLRINSIAVSNTTATVTVGAGTVDLNEMNGTLKIIATPVLGGAETKYTATIPGSTTNVTITQDIDTNKFIKAIVE